MYSSSRKLRCVCRSSSIVSAVRETSASLRSSAACPVFELVLVLEASVEQFEAGFFPEQFGLLGDLDPSDHMRLDAQGAPNVAQ